MKRQWHATPVLLPGKSHGQRSLGGCSPWGRQELDTTEPLHFHFSLSCIGEGNGNPLQCSCLENPRDNGAWWAAVYGVAQSRTRLKHAAAAAAAAALYHQKIDFVLFDPHIRDRLTGIIAILNSQKFKTFPSSSVVRTPHFQCKGHAFNP